VGAGGGAGVGADGGGGGGGLAAAPTGAPLSPPPQAVTEKPTAATNSAILGNVVITESSMGATARTSKTLGDGER
jgi:hypothetical protein